MDGNDLALVSSLYGKGTILCWFLTILSCLISWSCDGRKWKSDALDADFIAVLTLPAVAAGHIIYQIRSLRQIEVAESGPTSVQLSRAIEAPLTVSETYMVLSVILFIAVFLARCYKRAVLIALAGLLCLATEGVVYVELTKSTTPDLKAIPVHFTRSFVSDTTVIMVMILSVVTTCIVLAFFLAWYVFIKAPAPTTTAGPSSTSVESAIEELEAFRTPETILNEIVRREADQASREDRFMFLSTWSVMLLPITFVCSMMGMTFGPHGLADGRPEPPNFWSGAGHVVRRFLAAFFPKSPTGFTDLDQAVAVAAGATILSVTLWGVGRKWYVKWTKARHSELELRRSEDIRLRELRRRLVVTVEDIRRPGRDRTSVMPRT